mmetsp:Transcript_58855/g.156690  ORF Transcript_58855/g.156690 Transcript_58855/m.156690 type:complete len:215 (+) Transcript_58855:952-1596(+)
MPEDDSAYVPRSTYAASAHARHHGEAILRTDEMGATGAQQPRDCPHDVQPGDLRTQQAGQQDEADCARGQDAKCCQRHTTDCTCQKDDCQWHEGPPFLAPGIHKRSRESSAHGHTSCRCRGRVEAREGEDERDLRNQLCHAKRRMQPPQATGRTESEQGTRRTDTEKHHDPQGGPSDGLKETETCATTKGLPQPPSGQCLPSNGMRVGRSHCCA